MPAIMPGPVGAAKALTAVASKVAQAGRRKCGSVLTTILNIRLVMKVYIKPSKGPVISIIV